MHQKNAKRLDQLLVVKVAFDSWQSSFCQYSLMQLLGLAHLLFITITAQLSMDEIISADVGNAAVSGSGFSIAYSSAA